VENSVEAEMLWGTPNADEGSLLGAGLGSLSSVGLGGWVTVMSFRFAQRDSAMRTLCLHERRGSGTDKNDIIIQG